MKTINEFLPKEITVSEAIAAIAINDLSLDSRTIQPGNLFIAKQGTIANGSEYINDAIAKGAVAVLAQAQSNAIEFIGDIPIIKVKKLDKFCVRIASNFFGSEHFKTTKIVGITGTNGKTSVSHYIAQLFSFENFPVGILGTIGNGLWPNLSASSLTTADIFTTHRSIKQMAQLGAKVIAMEASSHALDQGRVSGLPFTIGILTNLTQDHLDYHQNMEHYSAAKARLFLEHKPQIAVLNLDDEFALNLAKQIKKSTRVIGFSCLDKKLPNIEYITASYKNIDNGMSVKLDGALGSANFNLPLYGSFNLSNALAAFASAYVLEVEKEQLIQKIEKLIPVKGRMQTIKQKGKPTIIIDYAHTPDAIKNLLQTVKPLCQGKLKVIFGCGGNRDKGKRKLMAKYVEKFANDIILTNDNPRFEDPIQIILDIKQGLVGSNHVIHLDRVSAIKNTILESKAEDWIVIAGKGHENYQEIKGVRLAFSDELEVTRALADY